MKTLMTFITCCALALMTQSVWAGNVAILNSFTAGTPAVAADVNVNFSAVATEVNDNDGRITTNTGNITTNGNGLAALQKGSGLALPHFTGSLI